MNTITKDSYILLQFGDIQNWSQFHEELDVSSFVSDNKANIILSFPESVELSEDIFIQLDKFSVDLKKINKSFVVVSQQAKTINKDNIVLIPTEEEAIEYIFMEEIERSF